MLLRISSFFTAILLWTWTTKTIIPVLWKNVIPLGLKQNFEAPDIFKLTLSESPNELYQVVNRPWIPNSYLECDSNITTHILDRGNICLECTFDKFQELFMSICNYFSNYQKNVTPMLEPAIDLNVPKEKYGTKAYRDKGTSISSRVLLALFLPIISIYIFKD